MRYLLFIFLFIATAAEARSPAQLMVSVGNSVCSIGGTTTWDGVSLTVPVDGSTGDYRYGWVFYGDGESVEIDIVSGEIESTATDSGSQAVAGMSITRCSPSGGTLSFKHREDATTGTAVYNVGGGEVGLTETTTLAQVSGVAYGAGVITFYWAFDNSDADTTMWLDDIVFTDD